jgi:hypothetical protein
MDNPVNKLLPSTTAKGIFWAILAFIVISLMTDVGIRIVSRGRYSLLTLVASWGGKIANPVVAKIGGADYSG